MCKQWIPGAPPGFQAPGTRLTNVNLYVRYKASMHHVTLQVLIEASKERQWEQKGPKKVKSRPVSLTVVTVRELQVQREVGVGVWVCVWVGECGWVGGWVGGCVVCASVHVCACVCAVDV